MRMRSGNPARLLVGAVADRLAREVISGRRQVLGLVSAYKRLYLTRVAGARCVDMRSLDFDVYLGKDQSEERILKVPRCGTERSCERYLALSRDKNLFEQYRSAMVRIEAPAHMERHINRALEIRRDGGYVSAYIKGYDLRCLKRDLLRDSARLDADVRKKIARQTQLLVDDIQKTRREVGFVGGKWNLENLVYDVGRDVIVNVSTQSFFWSEQERASGGPVAEDGQLDQALEELCTLSRLLERQTQKRFHEKVACVTRLLDYAKDNEASYSGRIFESGYHTIDLDKVVLYGQRHPARRLEHVPFDFADKVVLDIGCNIGGMLHHLAPRIKSGVGLDGSVRAVNAANIVALANKTKNLGFYVFNLDFEDFRLWDSFALREPIDICFLLSMCMWIRRWKQVVDAAARTAPHLLLETNGTELQQRDQLEYVRGKYAHVTVCAESSLDDSVQKNRKLYLCRQSAQSICR